MWGSLRPAGRFWPGCAGLVASCARAAITPTNMDRTLKVNDFFIWPSPISLLVRTAARQLLCDTRLRDPGRAGAHSQMLLEGELETELHLTRRAARLRARDD